MTPPLQQAPPRPLSRASRNTHTTTIISTFTSPSFEAYHNTSSRMEDIQTTAGAAKPRLLQKYDLADRQTDIATNSAGVRMKVDLPDRIRGHFIEMNDMGGPGTGEKVEGAGRGGSKINYEVQKHGPTKPNDLNMLMPGGLHIIAADGTSQYRIIGMFDGKDPEKYKKADKKAEPLERDPWMVLACIKVTWVVESRASLWTFPGVIKDGRGTPRTIAVDKVFFFEEIYKNVIGKTAHKRPAALGLACKQAASVNSSQTFDAVAEFQEDEAEDVIKATPVPGTMQHDLAASSAMQYAVCDGTKNPTSIRASEPMLETVAPDLTFGHYTPSSGLRAFADFRVKIDAQRAVEAVEELRAAKKDVHFPSPNNLAKLQHIIVENDLGNTIPFHDLAMFIAFCERKGRLNAEADVILRTHIPDAIEELVLHNASHDDFLADTFNPSDMKHHLKCTYGVVAGISSQLGKRAVGIVKQYRPSTKVPTLKAVGNHVKYMVDGFSLNLQSQAASGINAIRLAGGLGDGATKADDLNKTTRHTMDDLEDGEEAHDVGMADGEGQKENWDESGLAGADSGEEVF